MDITVETPADGKAVVQAAIANYAHLRAQAVTARYRRNGRAYKAQLQHLLDRATLLVHLDLPRATVMQQVVRRTLRRRLRREQLWNGNVEPPLHTIFTDPEHIVRWSWAGIEKYRRKVAQVRADHPGLPVVTLHSHREADEWLAGLS